MTTFHVGIHNEHNSFVVPPEFRAGLNDGSLQRHGAVIRKAVQGEPGSIVGYLQETAQLQKAQNDQSSATLKNSGGKLATSILKFAAGDQSIGESLQAFQILQVANVAMTAVGIGVTVIGTLYLASKIDRLETQLDEIGEKLDRISRGVQDLQHEVLAQDLDEMRTETQRVNDAWERSNPATIWLQAEHGLHKLQTRFARRASELKDRGALPIEREAMLAAHSAAASIRVSALLAADEWEAAARAAGEHMAELDALTGRDGVRKLLEDTVRDEAIAEDSPDYSFALERHLAPTRKLFSDWRGRELNAASVPLLIDELRRQGISGRAWLEAARVEGDQPVLCLTARS